MFTYRIHRKQQTLGNKNNFKTFHRKLDRRIRLQNAIFFCLVDQCSGHNVHLKFKNVRVEFLPANILQPSCNLVIWESLRTFIVNYRKQLLKQCILSIEAEGRRKSIKELKALDMIFSALEEVGRKYILSCYVKGAFLDVRRDEFENDERKNADSDEKDVFFPN